MKGTEIVLFIYLCQQLISVLDAINRALSSLLELLESPGKIIEVDVIIIWLLFWWLAR